MPGTRYPDPRIERLDKRFPKQGNSGIERIATGWRLKAAAPALIVCTHAQTPEAILASKTIPAAELKQAEELGAALAAGLALGVFLAGYGLARFIVEFFRQADAQFVTPGNPWGHVLGGPVWGITMGQLLSLPMIALGLAFALWAWRR